LHLRGKPSEYEATNSGKSHHLKKRKRARGKTLLSPGEYQAKAQQHGEKLLYWCEKYCVPASSWLSLRAMATSSQIVVPEISPSDPTIVSALVARAATSEKDARWRAGRGHVRGVAMAEPPSGKGHAVLIVEGASDAAAAIAAGFEVIGRHTRDADLTLFAMLFRRVPADHPIVLLVENDSAEKLNCEDWQLHHHLRCKAGERAKALASELGRPIVVSSPPCEINDFCDLWRFETDQRGHLIDEASRLAIGSALSIELLNTGTKENPCPVGMKKFRESKVMELQEMLLMKSEIDRQSAIERGNGIDADYARADSCSFFKSFHKVDEEKKQMRYLFSHLGCRSWKCHACRNRKLKPDWTSHLASVFSECKQIFSCEVSADSKSELTKKFTTVKAVIRRSGGRFVSIRRGECCITVFSDTPPKGKANLYEIETHRDHFKSLLEVLVLYVAGIDDEGGKPISTSREWSQGDPANLNDLRWKVTRIGEQFDAEGYVLCLSELSTEAAAELVAGISSRNRELIDPAHRCDFLLINSDNGRSLVMTSHPIAGSTEHGGEDAAKIVNHHIIQACGNLDDWRSHVRTSPRWTPKPTKQWRPLDSKASPSDAATAARAAGLRAAEYDGNPTEATLEGSVVSVASNNTVAQERFLSLLNHASEQ
tara:strand:- start:527 stop:2488 length:1962 start_codon:yes stop_codon:yes gene_type:complete